MKIALLSEKYTPDLGGLAISTGRLGHLLSSAGHEVRVFAPTSNPHLHLRQVQVSIKLRPSLLPSNEVGVTRFGAHKRVDDTLVDWFELVVNEHQREPFDVLHAYFLPQAGFVATYAGKYLNVPSVVSIRGNDIERAAFDPSKFSHVMYTLQNANAITTNAGQLAGKAKALFDREIFLIPNGVDVQLFKPMNRNKELAEMLGLTTKGHEAQPFVLGFAGELREKKGLRTLLNAYAQVNLKRPTVLLIVGEVRSGEDKQVFDELRLSIPNSQIIITGTISHKEIPAYYALMDVFVHPSLRDGMPNALLEAMACEKAVIATPVGGSLDLIEGGINGRIVPVNDVNALVKTVEELYNNPDLRNQLGRSARKKIRNEFTLEKELAGNLSVYEKLK